MLIGDKVRMLHGQGEGIVVRVEGDRIVIMLNEGIEIPVSRKHLVLVRPMQKDVPTEQSTTSSEIPTNRIRPGMLFLTEGLYLAGVPSSSMLVEYHLLNQSDYEVFVLVYRLARPVNQFQGAFRLQPKSFSSIPGSFPRQESNHLIGLAFQFVKFHMDKGEPVPADEFRFAFSHTPGTGHQQRIPLLEKEGFLLQMDGGSTELNPEKIRESLMNNGPAEKRPVGNRLRLYNEVDLHMEQLAADPADMNPAEMLAFQLVHFDKAMDRAIFEGTKQLIVIHGVGNGVLRNEIHRRLAANPNIRYFKDARREKFGYGATEIAF